ncbi:30S ribosomal protein S4 [Anaerocellum diazotrophicum]|uniref:Small ribosomal subunit protein uS4 n=1 Tax=Caldicellulosiruptor diazotrophicus TaxID=2806205 RepID=A0ABN6EBJ9_9FIRM|nr:30S ribosomal protein S4 [Caldicellulosiruptor diazotrophicus]BCS80861.1 30S ribosomal protein S4 [Caldicellulosiruptor diazotrophicus]
MSKYIGPDCRLCRREGMKLFLKGDRCYTEKCAFARRPYPPGQHGQERKKLSEYGMQLREKQKVKRIYGVLETQFRRYFEMAEKMKGIAGENLLSLLERRLDNVVYRLGFASSRGEARLLVSHAHFKVNGRTVNIPSYIVKVGDVIEVDERSKSKTRFVEIKEKYANKPSPKWLEKDAENLVGKVIALPTREDIDMPIREHLIVELYSK